MITEVLDNCGYWKYLGEDDVPKITGSIKRIDPSQLDYGGLPLSDEDYNSGSKSTPRILTRAEKGQALTHLEMDFNLGSLFHKLNTSSTSCSFTEEESSEDHDVYFERHKPSREEERAGLFATFSYAPIKNGSQSIIQNGFQTIKIQHTTDEIRYKLSNEQIPGTLDIEEDFRVTGSAFIKENVSVSGNLDVAHDTNTKTLNVNSSSVFRGEIKALSTASLDGDVYIKGNLYVNGVLYGNLAKREYNSLTNPGYAQPYTRFGTQDTGSHEVQSDRALKDNICPIQDSLYKLQKIQGYEFDWNSKAQKSGHDVGLIAQEVQTIIPEAVTAGEDGYLRVDYGKVIPLLVQAVNSLRTEVQILKDEIWKLRS